MVIPAITAPYCEFSQRSLESRLLYAVCTPRVNGGFFFTHVGGEPYIFSRKKRLVGV